MGGFGYQAPPAAPCPPAAQGQRPAGTLTPPSPESTEGVSAVASGPAEEGADPGARDGTGASHSQHERPPRRHAPGFWSISSVKGRAVATAQDAIGTGDTMWPLPTVWSHKPQVFLTCAPSCHSR